MNSTVCILKVGFSYFFLVFEEFSGTTVKDNFFFFKKKVKLFHLSFINIISCQDIADSNFEIKEGSCLGSAGSEYNAAIGA